MNYRSYQTVLRVKHFYTNREQCEVLDWIFIIGVPARRWLGEYVTLGKTFYSLLFKHEVLAVPATYRFFFLICRIPRKAFIINIITLSVNFYFFLWRCNPTRVMASSFLMFLDHTQRRTTGGRTPLDEWSARRRDLYLTTHNTHNRQTSMPPVGFELTISAGEQPQTYALDRAATGTGAMH